MKTIRVYRLTNLSTTRFRRLKAAQMEAARVWNCCMELHKQARVGHTHWPGQRELEQATKGRRFALNAQAVQQIVHTFLANIETTRTLRGNVPDAYEVSLARETLLPGQVARSGRPPREGARHSADGQRQPISRLAHRSSRVRRGLHPRLEPGL